MRHRDILIPLVLVLGGCASVRSGAPASAAVEERVVETAVMAVQVKAGAHVGSFVAAVPAQEDGGECEVLPPGTTAPDETLLLLLFPDGINTVRSLGLAFSPAGQLLHYNDLRGDLQRDQTGARTSIVLDFVQGTGTAMNEWPNRPGQAVFGTNAEFLREASVGEPQRMIELVVARCGAHLENSAPFRPAQSL